MSGIIRRAITECAALTCNARGCGEKWSSRTYVATHADAAEDACGDAFQTGWRIFAGARQQYTYCPAHGPKADMHLVHGGNLAATLTDLIERKS